MSTPAALGYRMPAEWEPHTATWLSWPHNPETWPGKIEPIPAVFAEIVAAVSPGERVRILVADERLEASARSALDERGIDLARVEFFRIPTNDAWMRDHGPIFLVGAEPEPAITDWGYNAWGGKYPPFDLDDRVPARLSERLGLRRFEPGMILEGGSIDVNGAGTLLTTESCLLNPNRNPSLSRADIERRLSDYLGIGNVLWLGDGIVGDDTDGHVDDLTRFVNPTTVITVVEKDPADENYRALEENRERLESMKDENGRPLDVVRLPMPRAIYHEGRRLPASYANFYIANRAVLVPTFRDPNDERACRTLAGLFPGRQVVPIYCADLILGLGAVHCVTQQQPRPAGT
ncbi:MAG: agmatine deiminase family protein [Candidatus Binatia bacterium]